MTNASEKYIEAVKWFGELFDFLNKSFFENALSKPVITVAACERNKFLGWFYPKEVWKENTEDKGNTEINISANFLNRSPIDIAETMLHEMCHLYAYENKLQDCSRGNTYHNKLFKKIAEMHGLTVECCKTIGWSKTALNEDSKVIIEKFLSDFKPIYRLPITKGVRVKSSSTRKYVCSICGQSVRATKSVNIMCMDCEQPMYEEE